jgi:predicted regulator of Ras-like GTPase activity (Roadblock/LC7/MglB family)
MPFREILDGLVREEGGGVRGALMLDSEGERVLEAGESGYRHQLIGAYQGLALTAARRTHDRYEVGAVQLMVCRYTEGCVILRPLKDGYYLILTLDAGADVARAVHRSERAQDRMNEAL